MKVPFVGLAFFALFAVAPGPAPPQEIKAFDKSVQLHGFGTQGFIYTEDNNWLTMNTSAGSLKFTDVGINLGSQLSSHVRIGVQGYDRELGKLGRWHPSLDWGMIDVNVKPWLGFRGGKVKTVLGLYNDRQDLDFANTYALLPQSIYPIDLRDATIAHTGGDVYGRVRLPHALGAVQYTAYGGHRSDSMHSGYPYLIGSYGTYLTSYGGPVVGGDVLWKTAIDGLTIGISRLNEFITGRGTGTPPLAPAGQLVPYMEYSKHDWTNQYYAQYAHIKLRVESEYRRYYRDQIIYSGTAHDTNDVRGWYIAGAYQILPWFEAGAYYSHYYDYDVLIGVPVAPLPPGSDHDYDKVVTGNFALNRFTTLKIEGHFMSGFGAEPYPNGFYTTVNQDGFQLKTNALVMRSSFSF
jgi:hypothetical protein